MKGIVFDKNDPVPIVLTGLGIALLTGTLLYILFVPAASAEAVVRRARIKEQETAVRITEAKAREIEVSAVLAARKSILPPDAIGPNALARVTALVKANGLRLIGFRPQRTIDSPSGLTLYPYQLSIEGTFPASAKFVRAVEGTVRDLAVTSFQAASADGESGTVNATVGIIAFRDTPKPAIPPRSVPRTPTPTSSPTRVTNGPA